ncbi:MAG: hypothetical protein ABIJ26_02620 [Candidatus Margulisiibacteriota bacterium]
MPLRKLWCIAILILVLGHLASAADIFPYGNIALRTPGIIDPFPGYGTYYSSLSKGLSTVMWNPASLASVKRMQLELGFNSTAAPTQTTRTYYVDDTGFNVGGSTQTGFNNYLLFTSNLADNEIKQRSWLTTLNYDTADTSMQFAQAIHVADMFSLAVTSRGKSGGDINLTGTFPVQLKSALNLYNTTNFLGSGVSVGSDGKMTFEYTIPGGGTYVATSDAAVWGGFLEQDQRLPISAISELRNSLNINSDLTFTGAFNWRGVAFGVNMTPISANANIDNSTRAVFAADQADAYFYVPDFDPNDQAAANAWMADPTKYASENGYKKSYIRVPAGEDVAEGKYQGFFEANTMRFDLGAIYDINDFFTVGFAYENMTGAALDFTGSGLTAYVQTRISTLGAGTLIQPGQSTMWRPFTDEYSTMPDTENIGMEENIHVELPRRMKFGVTLKKPWLISLDYEQQLNSIPIRMKNDSGVFTDYTISNLSLLRIGAETRIFAMPMWLRTGMVLLMKPSISGLDTTTQDSFDSAFKYGVLPLQFNLGTNIQAWGLDIGGSLGVNGTSILNLIQLDTLSTDISKMAYYTFYFSKDNWKLTYDSTLDPGATASAYSAASNKDDYLAIAKWINTLALSVSF